MLRFVRTTGLTVVSILGLALSLLACGQEGIPQQLGSTSSTSASSASAGSTSGSGSGGAGGSEPVVDPEPLTIMNWNVRNLFNDSKDSTITDEIIVSTATYQNKLGLIAETINKQNPDIVVLQEVENLKILGDLDTGHLFGHYPHRALIDANDPRGIDVGVISKYPFDSVVSHKDDSFVLEETNKQYRYARDCLELHLTFNQRPLALLGVHYISKSSPNNDDKRVAEARYTRAIANDLMAANARLGVIILGDFNDTPGSIPYDATAGAEPSLFVDATEQVASADRWTYQYQGAHELIDHQFGSPRLAGMVTKVVIDHSSAYEASDHAPVIVTYAIQ